jgi:hypothetical protein
MGSQSKNHLTHQFSSASAPLTLKNGARLLMAMIDKQGWLVGAHPLH